MPRLIAGQAKGKKLKVLGKEVRPTSDKIRQALFNTLEHRFYIQFDNLNVLDLYAGTGALGLEALSRGATKGIWVESEKRALQTLKQNIKLVNQGLRFQSQVIAMPVEKFIKRPVSQAFDLIFVDPPYHLKQGPIVLDNLHSSMIHSDTLVIIEHDKRDLFDPPSSWSQVFIRKYSDTMISIYQKSDENHL